MKYSIVIPTSGHHKEDLLKPCCESILKNTNMAETEVIVVANGCTDGTADYVRSLGFSFKLIEATDPLGYPKATNLGMKASQGEFIILLNDDTVILDNRWIDILRKPFDDPDTGITGPVKFWWNLIGLTREAIAFWCCMFRRSLIDEIGYLDEIFCQGTGEDGDYSIKATLIGYKLVRVPTDISDEFGKGISNQNFPIWHKGNVTFSNIPEKDAIINRNEGILINRFGSRLERMFEKKWKEKGSDTGELFPILRRYANRCDSIVELGVRDVCSTYAFLASLPQKMTSYDIYTSPNINEAIEIAQENNIQYQFIEKNVLEINLEETDLLFIDTLHCYKQLSKELQLHANNVQKYIILHDTETWGYKDEQEFFAGGLWFKPAGIDITSDKHGLQLAVQEFLKNNSQWELEYETKKFNGLIILKRIKSIQYSMIIPIKKEPSNNPKFSIIVPTCNSKGTLKTCLDNILKYTDISNKEIIVAANGCDQGTLTYLSTLPILLVSWEEKQGQIIPVNRGAELAKGEYLVFIDDDSYLLEQAPDQWINRLYQPFVDNEKVGMTGIFMSEYPYLGLAGHNGCTMYRKNVWNEVKGADTAFGFGYLFDTDLSLRIKKAGYELADVGSDHMFPIFHPDSPVTTELKRQDVSLMRENRNLLYDRHGKKPKISIIVPTYGAHLEDCLRPCLDGVKKYTKLEDVEVIVVANGCTDGTADYVDSLGHPFKLVWFDKGLGFTRATNEGIKRSVGDYIVLLNNDTVLLEQGFNSWIEMLIAPFESDPMVGLTGPLQLHDNYADRDTIIFFCAAIRRDVLNMIPGANGLLCEDYSPGGGEDIWCSAEIQNLGYKQVMVPSKEGLIYNGITNTGAYPIYHKGEATFSDREFPLYGKKIIKDNGFKNMVKYNKHIKLNLGSGGIEIPGTLSVDKFDTRASILMDVFDLDLSENLVDELYAIHIFEHTSPYRSVELLSKWCKILKPGCKLIMELPNILEICKDIALTTDKAEHYGLINAIYGSVNSTENSKDHPEEITAPHLFGWTPEILRDHLIWAGFTDIVFLPEQFPHPPKPSCNMRVEARKPG